MTIMNFTASGVALSVGLATGHSYSRILGGLKGPQALVPCLRMSVTCLPCLRDISVPMMECENKAWGLAGPHDDLIARLPGRLQGSNLSLPAKPGPVSPVGSEAGDFVRYCGLDFRNSVLQVRGSI